MTIHQLAEKGKFTFWECMQAIADYPLHGIVSIVVLILFLIYPVRVYLSEKRILNEKLTRVRESEEGKEQVASLEKEVIRMHRKESIYSIYLTLYVLPLVVYGLFFYGFTYQSIHNQLKMNWAEKEVPSFMDALPPKQADVEEVQQMEGKGRYFHTANRKEHDLLTVNILYVDEKGYGKSYKGEAIIQFDLKEHENPYITYKYLEKDLGSSDDSFAIEKKNMFDLQKGMYNPVIHLKKGTLTHLEKTLEKK